MNYLPNGVVMFYDMNDLLYDLFMEIGLGINSDKVLYDQENGAPILFKEKYIKASIDGTPVFAGRNDILFEPDKNYSLMVCIFAYYLDKCKESEDGDILQGYIAHYIEDNLEKDKQRVVVKSVGRGLIESAFYYNIYLSYIDCIFRIAGYYPDLSNFDIKPEPIK